MDFPSQKVGKQVSEITNIKELVKFMKTILTLEYIRLRMLYLSVYIQRYVQIFRKTRTDIVLLGVVLW